MTLEERLKMYEMVHAMNDRLLYLEGDKRIKFVKSIDLIFKTYPCPREVKYGSEAKITEKNY